MRRRYSLVGALRAVTIALFLTPQLASGAPVSPEIKSVVAFVFSSNANSGDPSPRGTGFFVGVPDLKDSNTSFVYLVTAKHVLQSDDRKSWLPKILLRLNTKKGDTGFIEVPIVLTGSNQTVFVHPSDSSTDVAVIPILPDVQTFEFKFVPMDFLTSKQDFTALNIAEGSEVFFTGLFTPHVGTRRNYPVIRFGRVAMITDEKVKFSDYEADLYLVETSSYGGNSGSPLFFHLGVDRRAGSVYVGPPVYKLAGVISGTFLDLQPIRAIGTTPIPGATSNMGIAAIVPAYKVMEILSGHELMTKRQH